MKISNIPTMNKLALLVNNHYYHPITCGNDACNGSRDKQFLDVSYDDRFLECWACEYTQDLKVLDKAKALVRRIVEEEAE